MLQASFRAVNEPRRSGPALLVLVAVATAVAGPAGAEPASPELERALELAGQLEENPRGVEGVVLVEALFESWDEVGPGLVTESLERVAASRRADSEVRRAAAVRLAEAALRVGDLEAARRGADALGVVRRVAVVGPMDNTGGEGLERVWPPEADLLAPLELDAPLEGAERPVRWRALELHDPLGVAHLDGYLRPAGPGCAYVATALELEAPRDVVLRVGGRGALVLWVDGRQVLRDPVYRGFHPDRFAVAARLGGGVSRVLAKVCGETEAASIVLRVTDRAGVPLGGSFRAGADLLGRALPRAGRARALPTPLSRLLTLSRRSPGTVALYLHVTDSDDPAEPIAPDLAAGVAAERPTPQALLFAAELARDRNRALQHLDAARLLTPDCPRVAAALAEALSEGPNPTRALPVTAAVLASHPGSVRAAAVRARLLGNLGLPLAGLSVLESAAVHAGWVPVLLESGLRLAEEARAPDRGRELAGILVSVRHDRSEGHRTLLGAACARGEPDVARRAAAALERAAWFDLDERVEVAGRLDRLGLEAEAEARLRALVEQAPDAHEGHGALARLLAGLGRPQDALDAAARALALRPQDRGLRELAARLLERDPFEDEHMESPEAFLARRGGGAGGHAVYLLDLTVVRVHASGLASRFRQIAAEVVDEQGASELRGRAVVFVPGEQEVTIRRARVLRRDGSVEEASGRYLHRLSDPSVRMYYDESAEVVELPRLRPGDVVEYAWRVDDVAPRNLMGDYFGDLALFQGVEPLRRVAYVLVHPPGMTIHASEPALEGLARTRRCDEARCVLEWEARDVPAIRPEEDMPALAELAARLHLSTYGDWADIARWYWGLVRDQLVPDESLRAVVAGIVEGLETDAERVGAVHRWVVERTRYVALEFGIHGYRPYRVTQVVERGFGDCKDKASLLVAMLRLAGVEASLVLLRTRGGGGVPPSPPSLALFDHAIAYVPSLDLYLDGTAEQSGTRELPWMDQGVTALVVSTSGEAHLVTTPVDAPERNVERRIVELTLAADGSARGESRTTVQGAGAARMRYHFQAPGLRQERTEASLASSFPGAQLLEHRFEELADRERPVELRLAFEAPRVGVRRGESLLVETARQLGLARRWARRSSRRTAVELGTPPHVVEEVRTVLLGPAMAVERLPEDRVVESPFGSLEVRVHSEPGWVRVTTRLVMTTGVVSAEAYPEFRRFCRSVDEVIDRRLVVRTAAP